MKKFISMALLFCALGTASTLGVFAAEVNRESGGRGFVSVSSNVSDDFTPDVAVINFYIETSDKNLTTASDENKKIAARAMENVKKELNTQKGEGLKTLGFNVAPEYSYKNNVKNFEKYNVTNSFEVKLKDMDKLGKVISIALNAGVTRVDGLRFLLDDTDAACDKLITQAVMDAKNKSTTAAKALGMKLGGVKQMSMSCNADGYYPQFRTMTLNAGMAKDSAEYIPTEAGTVKARANLEAQFYLVP